ncbi:MAG: (2Fe-2S)-binding protein [Spirochaetales bacterium]|nr:(2Fe-2S)-binding protein [Spirochaetales bacterium]
MPTVTIEGKRVTVPRDTTILEAARRARVWIPTLCHRPGVEQAATCRMCMVEVWATPAGGEGSPAGAAGGTSGPGRMVTACNYPVRRDITVDVNGERATRIRRGVMELLLARSPESEELRALAARMGVLGTPYPTVTESQRNCILCGLCVSVCEEAIGASAIGFAGRGVDRAVAAPFRQPSEACIACGACAAVCPVGTIQVRIHADSAEAEISPFKNRAKLLVCEECGRRLVSVPVAKSMFERVGFDWDEFRTLSRLCPVCRRKHAAALLGHVAGKTGGGPSLESIVLDNRA